MLLDGAIYAEKYVLHSECNLASLSNTKVASEVTLAGCGRL